MLPTLVREAVLLSVCLAVAEASSDEWCPWGYWKAWCGDTWECQVEDLPEQFGFWTCLRNDVTCKRLCKDVLSLGKGHATPVWAVLDGKCTIDAEDCLLSPNYPEQYNNYDSCSIDVNHPQKIASRDFNTETYSDALTVNGQEYSGTEGPGGIVASGQITWRTDGSSTRTGFKLCPLYRTSALAAFGPAATETIGVNTGLVAAAFGAISGLVLLTAATGHWLRRREDSAAVPLLQGC